MLRHIYKAKILTGHFLSPKTQCNMKTLYSIVLNLTYMRINFKLAPMSYPLDRKGLLLTLLFLTPLFCMAQQQVAKEILALQNGGAAFQKVEPVKYESVDLSRNAGFTVLSKGALLRLNQPVIKDLINDQSPLISLKLPAGERGSITLDLIEQNIFSEGFHVYTSDNPDHPTLYTAGKHYRGIVHGDLGSIVAISVFENEINGLISTNEGNLVLGKVEGSKENLHILYNDTDLKDKPIWE